jgi:hypothetical protein
MRGWFLVLLLGACRTPGTPTQTQDKALGTLVVAAEIADATVYIDGRLVGRVSRVRGGMRMRAGEHRLEVRHEGHHTRYLEVDVPAGQVTTVKVDLAELLP